MYRFLMLPAIAFACVTSKATTADSVSIYFKKGITEKQQGHLLQSYEAFSKAYSFDKTDRQNLLQLAESLLSLRKYAQAKEKYAELVQLGNVQDADVYKQLTTLSFSLRQFNDVITYARLLKKVDDSQKVSLYIGKAQYQLENFGEALKYLEEAAKENPADGEVPYMMARIYADMENAKRAIPLYEKAVELNPGNSAWLFETGLILYENNDPKTSLKYFLLAGEKGYPQNNEYLQNLAVAYTESGNLDKGMELFQQLLARRPQDVALLKMVARTYYEAKKYNEAITYWNKVLELNEDDTKVLYMTGICYQKKGDEQKGETLCNQAIKANPSLGKYRQEQKTPLMD